jgi:hypothetical protein
MYLVLPCADDTHGRDLRNQLLARRLSKRCGVRDLVRCRGEEVIQRREDCTKWAVRGSVVLADTSQTQVLDAIVNTYSCSQPINQTTFQTAIPFRTCVVNDELVGAVAVLGQLGLARAVCVGRVCIPNLAEEMNLCAIEGLAFAAWHVQGGRKRHHNDAPVTFGPTAPARASARGHRPTARRRSPRPCLDSQSTTGNPPPQRNARRRFQSWTKSGAHCMSRRCP